MAGEGINKSNQYHIPTVKNVGVRLVLFVFVFSQFVEVNFGTFGSIDVSLQKLIAVIFYPLSILLMGYFYLNMRMIGFAFLLLASFLVAYLGNFSLDYFFSAIMIVLVGLVGAITLYTAFIVGGYKSLKLFALMWIGFSILTSIITILQAVGIFPFLTVPNDLVWMREATGSFFRGVGLKFDPNFQALMLAIGFSFILIYVKKEYLKFIFGFVILIGILGTFSRMGWVLVALIIFLNLVLLKRKRNFLNGGFLLILLLGIYFTTYGLIPNFVKDFINARFLDVKDGLVVLFSGEIPRGILSSAVVRALLARASFTLALQNWLTGIGAFRSKDFIYSLTGIMNVAHNTYLEIFLVGGILGIGVLIAYVKIILDGFLYVNKTSLVSEKKTFITISLVFAITGIFLSLLYNSIFWFPLVLALTMCRWQKESC